MTRVNVVPVQELDRERLLGEKHEITRVFNLVRNAQQRGINKYNKDNKLKAPKEYKMGTGHVKFFYDKLRFVANRYKQICEEGRRRGYNINEIPESDLLAGIDSHWINDYTPTKEAIQISWQRIKERMNEA